MKTHAINFLQGLAAALLVGAMAAAFTVTLGTVTWSGPVADRAHLSTSCSVFSRLRPAPQPGPGTIDASGAGPALCLEASQ